MRFLPQQKPQSIVTRFASQASSSSPMSSHALPCTQKERHGRLSRRHRRGGARVRLLPPVPLLRTAWQPLPATPYLLQTNIICILPEAVAKPKSCYHQVSNSSLPRYIASNQSSLKRQLLHGATADQNHQKGSLRRHNSCQSHRKEPLLYLRKKPSSIPHRGERTEQGVDTLRFILEPVQKRAG